MTPVVKNTLNHSLVFNQWNNSPSGETCMPVCFFPAWLWVLGGGISWQAAGQVTHSVPASTRRRPLGTASSAATKPPPAFTRDVRTPRKVWSSERSLEEGLIFFFSFCARLLQPFPHLHWGLRGRGGAWIRRATSRRPPSALCVAWQQECEEWLDNCWLIALSSVERDEVGALL